MSSSPKVTSSVFEAVPETVEDRIISLLASVSSKNARLDIVLELMSRITIPWSDNVQNIIVKGFSWASERRLGDLGEHYRLLRMKKMLLKYNLSGYNIQDYSFTNGISNFLIMPRVRSFALYNKSNRRN